MPAQNFANFTSALKIQFPGLIREVINMRALTVNMMKKGNRKWKGRQIQFPIHTQRSNAVAFGVGGEAAPPAGYQHLTESTISLKQVWGLVQVTSDVAKISKGGMGASFKEAVSFELEGMAKEMGDLSERSIWGDGTGKIGEVESFSGSTVTTSVMSDTQGSGLNGNADNRYIRQGMFLDFYDSAGAARFLGAEVTSVDISDGTFVISGGTSINGNPAATDGIYIRRPSQTTPIGAEWMGIPGIVDDGTWVGTLQGIVRSTTPMWKAQVINAGTFAAPGSMQQDLVQRAIDLAEDAAASNAVNLWGDKSVRRELLKLGIPDVRFNPREIKLGFTASETDQGAKSSLSFNEKNIITSRYAPWRTLFGIPDGVVRFYPHSENPEWVTPPDGGSVLYPVPGFLGTFQGQLCWLGNVGTDQEGPNGSFVIRNINVSNIDRYETA